MNTRTKNTIEKLRSANWFSKVGIRDAENAIILASWPEALEHCASDRWQLLCIEAANRYREQLMKISKERFLSWNDTVREIRPVTQELVREKITALRQQEDLPQTFEDCVNWDIVHVAMEAEFSDICRPGFFASQAYWYVAGHFPCGWQGDFPQGKLVIY